MMFSPRSPRPWRVLLALALALAAFGPPVAASGPLYVEPLFWYSQRPNPEVEAFLAGQPAVMHRSWDRESLVAAYLHLVAADGRDLGPLAPAWSETEEARTGGWAALGRWSQARREVLGSARMPGISPSKSEVLVEGSSRRYLFYDNCLADAFETAAGQLEELVATHGAESGRVTRWIDAQDRVFSNCGRWGELPEPADEEADAAERRDRAYQIAAAHFYRGAFDEAALRFREIAADRSSRWSDLAAYLVARCAIRAASLEKEERESALSRAETVLETVLADPSRAAVHEPARRLRGYVALRLRPDVERRRLEERILSAAAGEATLEAQELTDFLWLARRMPEDEAIPTPAGSGDPAFATLPDDLDTLGQLTVWLRAVDPSLDPWAGWRPERAEKVRLARWLARRSEQAAVPEAEREEVAGLPWLVAVGLHLVPGHPAVESWLSEAARVPASSWVAPTVAYLRGSLLADLGRWEEAREVVDEAIGRWIGEGADGEPSAAAGALAPGDRNRFRELRARLTPALDDLLAGSQLPVVAEHWGDGSGEHPAEEAGRILWPREVEDLVDSQIPVERMLEIVGNEALSEPLRRAVLRLAWTRAVLLDLELRALDLAPDAEALGEEALVAAGEAFRRAAPGPERQFVGALALLRLPGLRPWLDRGYGRELALDERSSLRWNGWCASPWTGAVRPMAGLDAGERRIAADQLRRIQEMGPSPIALGRRVFDWAERHRDDPRVPEALHRVVRATRYGACTGTDENGAVSRRAFEMLHQRYPDSPWTEKTPYWFR